MNIPKQEHDCSCGLAYGYRLGVDNVVELEFQAL